ISHISSYNLKLLVSSMILVVAIHKYFGNVTVPTVISTLSLHDALPIYPPCRGPPRCRGPDCGGAAGPGRGSDAGGGGTDLHRDAAAADARGRRPATGRLHRHRRGDRRGRVRMAGAGADPAHATLR